MLYPLFTLRSDLLRRTESLSETRILGMHSILLVWQKVVLSGIVWTCCRSLPQSVSYLHSASVPLTGECWAWKECYINTNDVVLIDFCTGDQRWLSGFVLEKSRQCFPVDNISGLWFVHMIHRADWIHHSQNLLKNYFLVVVSQGR